MDFDVSTATIFLPHHLPTMSSQQGQQQQSYSNPGATLNDSKQSLSYLCAGMHVATGDGDSRNLTKLW